MKTEIIFIIKVGVGKAYDGHVVKWISKIAIFQKKWRYSIVIRLKYVLFYKSHIEAAGRPPSRPSAKMCVLKNEDLQAKIGEK